MISYLFVFLQCYAHHLNLHSFPTRRSADLLDVLRRKDDRAARLANRLHRVPEDRKSTRLNSSHITISYAVFCLKKKRRAPARSVATQALLLDRKSKTSSDKFYTADT